MRNIPSAIHAIIASICLSFFIFFAVDAGFILVTQNQVDYKIAIPVCLIFGVTVFGLLIKTGVYRRWWGNAETQEKKPISNRDKLIRKLFDANEATKELIQLKSALLNSNKPDSYYNNPKVMKGIIKVQISYQDAIKELEKEILVAGSEWEKLLTPLKIFMQAGVAFFMAFKNREEVDHFEFTLDCYLKDTIAKIDDLMSIK